MSLPFTAWRGGSVFRSDSSRPRAWSRKTPRLKSPSDLVYRETGCHGVAEGAALASVGAAGDLILPKRRSAHATCALARMHFSHQAEAKRA